MNGPARARIAIAAALLVAICTTAGAAPMVSHGNAAQQPDRVLLARVVAAGQGPNGFAALTLIDTLAGSRANAIVAAAVREHGAADVKQALRAIDLAIGDARQAVAANGGTLPVAPPRDEIDGSELADALYRAGTDPATHAYRVDTMLERLVSKALYIKIRRDVDRTFGTGTARACHDMLVRAIADAGDAAR